MTQQNDWQNGVWHGQQAYQETYGQPQPQPQPQPQVQPEAQPFQAQPQTPYAAGPQPQVDAVAQASQPKKRGWIVALVAVILLAVVSIWGIASCTSAIDESVDSLSGWGYSEVGETYGDTIGIIELSGTIQYDKSACSPEGLKDLLDVAEENPDIKAVVLRVDSGGGTATAGEEMAEYVRGFSKPIVVSSASLNASAAYEISSQTDYIFVARSTAIGSIGTAMQLVDLSGLYEKLGISMENITSSDSKDSSYGTRALTEEERAAYQRQVDQINEQFIEAVAEGRGMDIEAVRALANGMTYSGIDAVENGLADEVGTLEDAIAKACELAGIDAEATDAIYLESDSYYSDLASLFTMLDEADFLADSSNDEVAALLKELQ